MQEITTKAVIFDFDGTIADTLPAAINIARKLNQELKLVNEEEFSIEEFRNVNSDDFIKRLNIPIYKLIYYLWKFRRILGKQVADIPMFDGLAEVLVKLHDLGIKLAVVSLNTESNINKFLKNNNGELFDIVECPILYFNKAKVIKRVAHKLNVDPENVFYVGDETRDIIAAHEAGIKVISVTWGYHFRDLLVRFKPDYTADTPEELLNIIIG